MIQEIFKCLNCGATGKIKLVDVANLDKYRQVETYQCACSCTIEVVKEITSIEVRSPGGTLLTKHYPNKEKNKK